MVFVQPLCAALVRSSGGRNVPDGLRDRFGRFQMHTVTARDDALRSC